MPDSPEAKDDPHQTQPNNESLSRGYVWRIVLYSSIAYAILLGLSIWWPNLAERTKFFTNSGLLLALLIVAIAQVLVYHRQWQVMDRSLVISQRAYVGVHSIETELTRDSFSRPHTLIIRIENIGKIPASEINVYTTVSMFIPDPELVGEHSRRFYSQVFNENFGGVQLFPGSLKFEVRVPLLLTFSGRELVLAMEQKTIFTAHVKIVHNDGFDTLQQSEFFFHYLARANRWIPRAVKSAEEICEKEYAYKDGPEADPRKEKPN